MGTYTANYNLYMPTIGEQGWGELINGNYQTIDTTMKGLDTRATALENADTAFDARITTLEAGEFENIIANDITVDSVNGVVIKNSGTITVTPSNNSIFYSLLRTNYSGGTLLLPLNGTAMYSGSIRFKNTSSYEHSVHLLVDSGLTSYGVTALPTVLSLSSGEIGTYSFSNIPYLQVWSSQLFGMSFEPFILT